MELNSLFVLMCR